MAAVSAAILTGGNDIYNLCEMKGYCVDYIFLLLIRFLYNIK